MRWLQQSSSTVSHPAVRRQAVAPLQRLLHDACTVDVLHFLTCKLDTDRHKRQPYLLRMGNAPSSSSQANRPSSRVSLPPPPAPYPYPPPSVYTTGQQVCDSVATRAHVLDSACEPPLSLWLLAMQIPYYQPGYNGQYPPQQPAQGGFHQASPCCSRSRTAQTLKPRTLLSTVLLIGFIC
jgi:hypothetical protein